MLRHYRARHETEDSVSTVMNSGTLKFSVELLHFNLLLISAYY